MFDIGFFKETSFKIPIITVGNLSVGGTGKTPQIEYLIRLLKDKYALSILSRGYKRNTKEFVLLDVGSSAQEVGDEPLQYFNKFKNVDVAVDTNRVNGIRTLIAAKNSAIVLLDDAFQHRKVKSSFNILLTKYKDLFVDDFLLPSGNLRESAAGAKRANVIIVTKCPKNTSISSIENIQKKLQQFKKPVFFSTISYADKIKGSNSILTSNLKDYDVLLITGIANPTPLLQHLKSLNVRFEHQEYADHHHFSKKEIEQIQQKFSKMNVKNKILLTTEKDYTRLYNQLEELNYLAIETQFLYNQKEGFDNLITSHIQNFSSKS
jgi:tetraacyldisaccharide 4'-kinase